VPVFGSIVKAASPEPASSWTLTVTVKPSAHASATPFCTAVLKVGLDPGEDVAELHPMTDK